jgi:hypothetical protein
MVRRRHLSLACVALALAACGPSIGPPADASNGGGDGASERGADGAPDRATDGAASDALDGAYAADGPCMPGLPRCDGDFGYRMCQQDGTWGPPESCAGYSMNGTTSYCAEIPVATGGTWGTCVDPACWYWFAQGALAGPLAVGVCLPDGTLDRCDRGGALAIEPCAGACTQVATLDGRAVGYCAPECADGARECLGGSFYRACANGRWGADTEACDPGDCVPVPASPPGVQCGGACFAGTSRCSDDRRAVESCGTDGAWTLDRTCLVGLCAPAGLQAECETECAPGMHQCAYDGAPTDRLCDATGLWLPETTCATGTNCRLAGGVAQGCVACVGVHAGVGNTFGPADSRCVADGGVQSCDVGNTWTDDAPCASPQVCKTLSDGPSTLAACGPP